MSLQCVFHNIVVCALFVLQVLLVSHLFQSSVCLGFVWERGKELSFTEKKKKKVSQSILCDAYGLVDCFPEHRCCRGSIS